MLNCCLQHFPLFSMGGKNGLNWRKLEVDSHLVDLKVKTHFFKIRCCDGCFLEWAIFQIHFSRGVLVNEVVGWEKQPRNASSRMKPFHWRESLFFIFIIIHAWWSCESLWLNVVPLPTCQELNAYKTLLNAWFNCSIEINWLNISAMRVTSCRVLWRFIVDTEWKWDENKHINCQCSDATTGCLHVNA